MSGNNMKAEECSEDVVALNPEVFGLTPPRTSDPAAILRGAQNQAQGAAFQADLDRYHKGLRERGLARVYRTDPPSRYVGSGRWVLTGKGPVDYIALSPGTPIHFDAKYRVGNAFSVSDDHQLRWLTEMAAFGHTCGFLVQWSDYDETRWHALQTVDGHRVRRADGILLNKLDWWSVLGEERGGEYVDG